MGTVTVLRLEDTRGVGCFKAADMQDYTDAAVRAGLMTAKEDLWDHFHSAARGFPAPFDDEELSDALDEVGLDLYACNFGFPDRDIARQWFPPCMANALVANNQTLTVWEVPEEHFAASDRQCVFRRDLATLVERLPVSALYEPDRQAQLPLAA